MSEILCLTCKETVTSGANCKCFFNEKIEKQYSKARLEAVDLENDEAKDEYPSTLTDNYSNLCSEIQQIQLKGYENVNLLEKENIEEDIYSSELNRIRKFRALTEQTGINGILENQYSHLNPTIKECELMQNKNNRPFLYLEEKLKENSVAASQETFSEINTFSTTLNFSSNGNFCPVIKNTNSNGNETSKGNLTESFLKFSEGAVESLHESKSLVNKVSESIESTKNSNSSLRFSENNPEFIISQNRRLDSLLTPGMFPCTRKTDDYSSSTSKKSYECDKCKELFFDRILFIRHYKSHSSKNLDVCGNSQNVMSCKENLEMHTLEKSFACNTCKKIFSKKSSLANHYRIHTKKQFVCDVCKKSFTQKRDLTRHYRIHTNEKPFVCNECGKGFNWKYCIVVHNRTHTGEKPYESDVCRKRFSQCKSLINHYQTHTYEKQYGSDLCEKRFNHGRSVVLHRRTHTGEKP